MTGITLTNEELVALTGYRRPADQLRALHAAGYWRARPGPDGAVILERAHADAVARGQTSANDGSRPRVKPAVRRAA